MAQGLTESFLKGEASYSKEVKIVLFQGMFTAITDHSQTAGLKAFSQALRYTTKMLCAENEVTNSKIVEKIC